MVPAIIILIILLLLIGLLFIPLDLYIDTRSKQYYAELKGLARASIEADKMELVRIRIKIPFKEYYYYPLKALSSPKKVAKNKKMKKKTTHGNRFTPKTILRLIRSFEIKRWKIDLDTGDCITNAKLYPLFGFMNYHFGGFHINFEGRNEVLLLLRNRPVYIIKSFINF